MRQWASEQKKQSLQFSINAFNRSQLRTRGFYMGSNLKDLGKLYKFIDNVVEDDEMYEEMIEQINEGRQAKKAAQSINIDYDKLAEAIEKRQSK